MNDRAATTVHLLVGLDGSGKTTHARRLEHELPAARFSLDEQMIRVHGLSYDDPAYPSLAETEQEEIWQEALLVLARARTSSSTGTSGAGPVGSVVTAHARLAAALSCITYERHWGLP